MSAKSTVISFKQSGIFSDRRYPRGLARSGVFTINEAQLLEQHGIAYQRLSNNEQLPINLEEQHFVDVAHGRCRPNNSHEKVWQKYQQTLVRRSYALTSSAASHSEEDRDDTIGNNNDLSGIEHTAD